MGVCPQCWNILNVLAMSSKFSRILPKMVHHGRICQDILNVPLGNTSGGPFWRILNFTGWEHCDHTAQDITKEITNEPLGNTRGTFFQEIQDVPMDYLIRTLQSHHWEHSGYTGHFLCWEHCNQIGLENPECVCDVLDGFLVGTLSISL